LTKLYFVDFFPYSSLEWGSFGEVNRHCELSEGASKV
jgi:hypothetical protein